MARRLERPSRFAVLRFCTDLLRRSPLIVAVALAACGGGTGGGTSDGIASAPLPAASAPIDRGTPMAGEWGAYPRVVRLAHQAEPSQNGRIVATLTEIEGSALQAGVDVSVDDGATFAPVTTVVDAAFSTGLCCGTLFEMPKAVGTLPAGTLLYAASVGADTAGTTMANMIFRSDDAGRSFHRIDGAACGRAALSRTPGAPGSGVWEPEFLLAADGSLACIYSDETEPGRSQVLKLTQTDDGATWSVPRVIVAGALASDRPGMAVVRRLSSGRYAMSFEACSTARADCSVHLKLSDDGLDWGSPADFGPRPTTTDGRYLRHAPTLAWTPVAGLSDGLLVLAGQVVASDADGVDSASSGRVLFVSSGVDGSGAWRAVAAPIGSAAPPSESSWCQNYSTPLLPSLDGAAILMIQTDSSADGGCVARFGQGALLH